MKLIIFAKKFAVAFIIVFASSLSLWLRSSVPAFAIADAVHDDQLFVRLAYHMIHREWLGEYNNLTHAKGLFYSIFIALSYVLGMPLKLAEQVFYLGAAGLFSWVMSRLTRRSDVGILLYVVLAFNPIFLNPSLARVIREGIYISLSLLVVATTVGAFLLQDGRIAERPLKGRVGWLIGLGCTFSAFWLTREEGVWILPALVPIIGAWSVYRWRYWRHNPPPVGTIVRGLTSELGVFVLPLACFLLIIGSVNLVNYMKYGVFRNNDFRSADFLSAYGAISRIQHDEWRNYVVFPLDARKRAYAVAPAAAELRPFFEGSGGEQWRKIGCNQMGIDPCPEILSGWFMWALRDAVREAGHYRSAVSARDFYLRLASEINDACDDHRLNCLPARATMMPPFRTSYLPDLLPAMWQLTGLLTRFGSGEVGAPPSAGAPQNMDLFFDLLSGGISPPAPRVEGTLTVKGWIAAGSGSPQLWIENLDGSPFLASLTFAPSPDVDAAFVGQGFGTRRFELKTNCLMESCMLVVRSQGQKAIQTGIQTLGVGVNINDAKTILYIDSKDHSSRDSPRDRTPATSARIRIQLEIARTIALGYAWAGPLLSIVACLGLITAMVRRGIFKISAGLMAVMASCAAAVLTRIVLLSYLNTTSIPSINDLYLSPATPFLIIFAILALFANHPNIPNESHFDAS